MTTSTDTRLFGTWLAATRELQESAYRLDYAKFDDPAELVAYIKDMHIATIAEMQEALDETSWKPWASDDPFVNSELVKKELIDALHFIANILTAVGATDEELSAAYSAKMDVNRERQARSGGYRVTGITSDKCTNCRRALDDVGASTIDPSICMLCLQPGVVIGDE